MIEDRRAVSHQRSCGLCNTCTIVDVLSVVLCALRYLSLLAGTA